MIKKIILSIVVISVALLTTTGFLYADNKNQSNSRKNNQEISEKDISGRSIFHITSSCNNGGTISPKGNQVLDKGDDITLTITAKTGYKLVWLRVDNVKMKDFSGGTYTITDVDKNHTIHALFKKIKTNSNNIK
ncbi:MAG: InlB B-repeat-containing protein [Candidatus Humimicrobiaceae bacterium]